MHKMLLGWLSLTFFLLIFSHNSVLSQGHPAVEKAEKWMKTGREYFGQDTDLSYDQALSAFRKAGNLFEQAGDTLGMIRAAILRSDVYTKLFQPATGISDLEQVADIARRFRPNSKWTGILLLRTGNQHYDIENDVEALHYFEEAEPILTRTLSKNDLELARLYQSFGYVYTAKGNRLKAIQNFRRAADLFQPHSAEHPQDVASIYKHLAHAYLFSHQSDQALLYGKQAVVLLEETYGQNHREVVNAYHSLGHIYTVLEDNVPSLKYHQKALEITMDNFSDNKIMVARGYNSMGNVYSNMRDSARSVDYYLRAAEVVKGAPKTEADFVSTTYHNLGILYFNYADYVLARAYWEKTLPYIDDWEEGRNYAITEKVMWIGEAYEAEGRYSDALQHYQRVISRLDQDYDSTDVYSIPHIDSPQDRDLMFTVLGDKAGLMLKRYRFTNHNRKDLEFAVRCYDVCLDMLDSLRKGTVGDNSRLDWNTFGFRFYEGAIQAAHEMQKVTGDDKWQAIAFQYMERSKGSVLMGAINSARAAHYAHVPDSLMELEATMRKQIGKLEMEIFEIQQGEGEIDQERLTDLKAESFQITRAFNALVADIEDQYPEYYKLKYDLEVVNLQELQSFLRNENATFLEFFAGDSATYTCAITGDQLLFQRLETDSLVAKVEKFLLNFRPGAVYKRTARETYPKEAFALYQALLAPHAALLPESGKLILVPDGKLGHLPFEALLSRMPTTEEAGDFSKFPYLLRQHTISYANSATLLLNQPYRRHSVKQLKLLAFAPEFGTTGQGGPYSEVRAGLSELRQAPIEVQKIARFIETDVYTGASATEALFKEDGANYNILHFATHGMVEDKNSLYSKIAFSPPRNSAEDGMLHTYELFSMKLNADLAVLSACNTGIGDVVRGEGIMSLARGFMYAGCPSIVMSLWSVNDESSSLIMEDFYRNLSKGIDKDQALRQSKLHYLEQAGLREAHPYFWAAHVLIGDTASFTRRGPGAGWLLLAFGILAGTGLLAWLHRKSSRKAG